MRNLIIRTITGIFFIIILVGSFWLPSICFSLLFLFFAIVGVYEYCTILRKAHHRIQRLLPLLITILLCCASWLTAESGALVDLLVVILYIVSFLLIWLIPIVELYRGKKDALQNFALAIFPILWIAAPFSMIILWKYNNASSVLAMLIIIWTYDTLAYCAGSLFGKHRLFERISPKKSWEGFIISLILTSGGATLFHFIPFFQTNVPSASIAYWIGYAAIIIIASTFGDLLESLIKRRCNVKDSGNILPGHGGILDRFDSLLLATPFAIAYLILYSYLFLHSFS